MLSRFVEFIRSAVGIPGLLVSFLLGALCNFGHAPFYIWPAFLLGVALLILRLDGAAYHRKAAWSGFWRGLAFGFGYYLFGFYWVGSAFIARGPEFVPFMPFAVALLCLVLALFWAASAAVYVKLSRGSHSPLRPFVFVCIVFLAEYVRGHLFGGLPWNLPGYVFKAGEPVSQIASITGIYGLSALALLLSAALALAIQTENRRFLPIGIGLAFLAALYGFGQARLNKAGIEYADNVKLRIVHANIPQRDKFDPDKYVENIRHYLRLTQSEGFDDVTHVIWPEGAVPGLMLEDRELMRVLDEMFRAVPGEPPVFVTQTLRAEPVPGRAKPLYYNAATAITFADERPPQLTDFYDKQKLVPFGEFIPGGAVLEKLGLKSLSSALESMTPGKTGNMPAVPGLPPVSIQICYEIIFPGFTPDKMPPHGASPEWILNLSNDSWYGNSTGPRQHINQVGYRAIEQGLPVIRSTSGGISGVLDPYGRLIAHRGLGEDGVLDTTLPRNIQKNAYNSRFNHIMALIILVLLITCCRVTQLGRSLQEAP